MSKAIIKVQHLPDAPEPTKPYSGGDPREQENAQRIMEHRNIILGKPDGHVPFWDRARVNKLHRLWNEGYGTKFIMRNVAAPNEQVVLKRLRYDIKEGRIEPRRKTLTDDEKEKVFRMKNAGMDIIQIAKEMRMSVYRINKIIKGEQK